MHGLTARRWHLLQLGRDVARPAADAVGALWAAASHERQQTFTLFANAYDEARRAVMFLRWKQGDADEIAPSIYAGRGGGRRAAADVVDGRGAAPAEDDGETPVGGAPATPRPRIEPGMPGSSPFINEP